MTAPSPEPRFSPRTLLSRHWIGATILVLLGMAVMIRLGVWQLDRLAQRQALNALTLAQLDLPPLDLNTTDPQTLSAAGDYRRVTARGEYDVANQVLLAQQRYAGRLGNHLITPLRLEGSDRAVLVDRGWVPATDDGSAGWPDYPQPGEQTVVGYPRATASAGRSGPAGEVQIEWFRVDVSGIASQLPYEVLPYYLLAVPTDELPPGTLSPGTPPPGPPYLEEPVIDLSNGPHLGYAVQWFLFTLILGGGYVYYVWRHERQTDAPAPPQPSPPGDS